MRVLVTSSRNPFALDLIRKLGSTGHTVVASDTYHGSLGSHSKYLTGHGLTASPRFDTDQHVADVNALVGKYDIDMIIPSFEEAFYLAARRKDLAEGVELFTGPFAKLARLHDKVSFQKLAQQAGVPVPETVVATDDESLRAAVDKFPRYFARAAFSRGGVALLTNTGPLAGAVKVEDCHPTTEQPWLVQPFVDGPMICTYSVVRDGQVVAHCTYRAPVQWEHSTGIQFMGVDSSKTLEYTQKFVDTLDPTYNGQLSFDYVDQGGELYAIECNPRSTDGILLFEAEELAAALAGEREEPAVVPEGKELAIRPAVLAEAFTEPLKSLPKRLHDAFHVRSTEAGWRDAAPLLWSPALLVHGAKLTHGEHRAILAALGDDIVWNGGPIDGMSDEDAAALEEVHAQRL